MEWKAACTSTGNSDEKKFNVDSGASMHMVSKVGLSPEELKTVKVSRLSTTVITANGSIDTTEEAMVYVKDLDIFVTAQLLQDAPNGCEENGIQMRGKKVKTQILSKITKLYLDTLRVQQKIQLKPTRSRHWMIKKRRKHRDIVLQDVPERLRACPENLVEPISISSGSDSKDPSEPPRLELLPSKALQEKHNL